MKHGVKCLLHIFRGSRPATPPRIQAPDGNRCIMRTVDVGVCQQLIELGPVAGKAELLSDRQQVVDGDVAVLVTVECIEHVPVFCQQQKHQ